MSETLTLVESKTKLIRLDSLQFNELERLRRAMAGSRSWWGDAQEDDDVVASPIRAVSRGNDLYEVVVADAIGALALPNLTLIVKPKIPLAHFTHIARRALPLARMDAAALSLDAGDGFQDLVAFWFLAAAERVVNSGLNVDYEPRTEIQPVMRGRLHAHPTFRRWLSGHVDVTCEFDDLDVDTAHNRVLKAGLAAISRGSSLSDRVQRRGRVLLRSFSSVGPLRPTDLTARLARGEFRYRTALQLAIAVLHAAGRSLRDGAQHSHSFLYRTPDLIEEGIRQILNESLDPVVVRKRGRVLLPTTEKVTPDLEIDRPPFTGDVKYKISNGKWSRPDLAQAVFFAAAFRSPQALVVGFREGVDVQLPRVPVGEIHVSSALWDASPGSDPAVAERRLVRAVRRLLLPAA